MITSTTLMDGHILAASNFILMKPVKLNKYCHKICIKIPITKQLIEIASDLQQFLFQAEIGGAQTVLVSIPFQDHLLNFH